MRPYIPNKIVVERCVLDSSITESVLKNLPEVEVEIIESVEAKLEEARMWSPSVPRAKKSLVLAKFKGSFLKACPGQQSRGSSKNVCCDYFVINFASNCHMECSYCYLQSYLNFPYLIVYANTDDLFQELEREITGNPQRFYRVGTGELADSLGLDPLTGYSRPLVNFFAGLENGILELKTKSDHIENLLDLDHRGKTVIAWSVNPEFIQETEEHKTATMEERVAAARECSAAGYPIGFHFDPIIHYPHWQSDYRRVVRRLFEAVAPEKVAWISLGGLRMNPGQKGLIRQRFPGSIVPLGELVPAEDGKLRYVKPIRVEMYRKMLEWIEEFGQGINVYACMERPEVWRGAFGGAPHSDLALGEKLVELFD
jgi:spore photoproduct lyase